MSLTGETATAICDLMEAQMTSEEFDASIKRNKLLHDCKTKGFKHLMKLGYDFGGISKRAANKKMHSGRKFKMPKDERIAKVRAINKLRREGVMAISAATQCGVPYKTYYSWSVNLGILPPPRVNNL